MLLTLIDNEYKTNLYGEVYPAMRVRPKSVKIDSYWRYFVLSRQQLERVEKRMGESFKVEWGVFLVDASLHYGSMPGSLGYDNEKKSYYRIPGQECDGFISFHVGGLW